MAAYGLNSSRDAAAAAAASGGASVGKRRESHGAASKPQAQAEEAQPPAVASLPSTSSTRATSDKEHDHSRIEMSRRASAVQVLARSVSQTTVQIPGLNGNPFLADSDSPLNPHSANFSARTWAKAVSSLVSGNGAYLRSAGVCFQNLGVYGLGTSVDYQDNVANVWLSAVGLIRRLVGSGHRRRIDILHKCEGLVRSGEMLLVLGPPGSGCSTLLKTIAGEMNGIYVDDGSYFNYQGMTAQEMHSHHRGEAIYTAENDVHLSQLTVGDTLAFAARARRPRQLPPGVDEYRFAKHLRDVAMAMFGISHIADSRVGNKYARGISGGERKRVGICEAALYGALLQCWDKSTQGLDSASAIEFCRTLRLQAELFNSTVCVSIYQSPQRAYELFDKVVVLCEGRQIFFGLTDAARKYFVDLGFECPARMTTPDFLTSTTCPSERSVRPGFEAKAPRTPDDFVAAWRGSAAYEALRLEMHEYQQAHPLNGPDAEAFRASRRAHQARLQRLRSSFILSYPQQIRLCLWRGWKKLTADPSLAVGSLVSNVAMSLIIGSVFYDMGDTTASISQRGALFFLIFLTHFTNLSLEIAALYGRRPIVEKENRYAIYHSSAEAIASMLCDMPHKIADCIVFNLFIYFLTNLRREPGAFFLYLVVSFWSDLALWMIYRIVASASRNLFQALVPAGVLIPALCLSMGFMIPRRDMLGWCAWLSYINPLTYAFEALMVNELHNRLFRCAQFVPSPEAPLPGLAAAFARYANVAPENRICRVVGALPGEDFVSGDAFIEVQFGHPRGSRWRNVGLLIAITIFLVIFDIVLTELRSSKMSKDEVLVFRRGHKPTDARNAANSRHNSEAAMTQVDPVATTQRCLAGGQEMGTLEVQTSVFQWHDVCYDIKVKGGSRRILDHVNGWVKSGILTALMGASGAGKTALLDCLAGRTSSGIVTGEILVNGKPRVMSFPRQVGYVQQQDFHLQTTTVREALNFSAVLRQPAHIPRSVKLAYVEDVIKIIDMEEYADAIIGVPGEGLGTEQRKRLTFGVELVAKPSVLLFVDEPTSGLDAQTSRAMVDLLEKLAKAGQAVLCTIHQPSATLFQRFDRLLLLDRGGKTVYFGDIGDEAKTLTSYFERNGGYPCPDQANPAEWMLQVIGRASGSSSDVNWFKTWRNSPEYRAARKELRGMKLQQQAAAMNVADDHSSEHGEFAAPFTEQFRENLVRVFQQYWRNPAYIYGKTFLSASAALFISFAFSKAPPSIQGLRSQAFSIIQLLGVFSLLVQQTIPQFVVQRSLYEARERYAKVYSWQVFVLSQVMVELPWNALMAAIMYGCWYYPMGFYQNAAHSDDVTRRGLMSFLFLLMFLLFSATFGVLAMAGFETAEAAGNVTNLLFLISLVFCGVLVVAEALPGFWIFAHRASPLTYLVSGLLSSGVANTEVTCADHELLLVKPPVNQTCAEFLLMYALGSGGRLLNPSDSDMCSYCPLANTDFFLWNVNSNYADRWRNFGILWAYIFFNIVGALFIYWLVRVPKNGRKEANKEGTRDLTN